MERRRTESRPEAARPALPRGALSAWLFLQSQMTSALYNVFFTMNVPYNLIFITDF